MFDPDKFSMPKRNKHKERIMPLLQFMGGKPMITLRPHENGRLQVIRDRVWIATIIPHILDDGEEWVYEGQPDQYTLLSHPDSEHEYRGDCFAMGCIISALQQNDGDWEAVSGLV